MGIFDFSPPRKWNEKLLHHQSWDTVTWDWLVRADSEEGIPSQIGCRKGRPHPQGSKFSQQRQRSAPLKPRSTCTSHSVCRGCRERVSVPVLGTSLGREAVPASAQVAVCRWPHCLHAAPDSACLELKCCGSQSPIGLKAAIVILITLHYQHCLLPPEMLLTEGANKVGSIWVCVTSWLETLFCGSFRKDVCTIGFLSW